MSTKTITKRIALVAVAALTIGGFSAVPAFAANTVLKCDIADGRSSGSADFTTGAKCSAVAGPANTVVLTIDEVGAQLNDRLTIAGAGATFSGSGNATKAAIATNGLSATLNGTATTISVATPTVGTITVELYRLVSAGGTIYEADPTDTVTITVNKTASSGVVSTTFSKVQLSASTDLANTDIDFTAADATIAADGLTSGTRAAIIGVFVKDALNTAVDTAPTVKAEVSGVGVASVATEATNATYANGGRSDSAVAGIAANEEGADTDKGDEVSGVVYVAVYADGTAGTSTIKITQGTTVLGTKTVTFYGNVSKVVATQRLAVASTTGESILGDKTSATAFATKVVLTDANGNPAVAAVTATPADTSVIASGSCAAFATTPGTYYCQIVSASASSSGKSTTVTFSAVGASAAVIKSEPITFTLGGSVAAVSLAFDATSYAPGAPVALNITAKDSSGNPVFDGAKANLVNASGLVFNYATGVSTADTVINALTFIKGVATVKTFAPLAAGSVSVAGTLGDGVAVAARGTSITAEAAVEGDQASSLALDAANAATDAANNAYDEAQNATQAASDALAAVTALAAQVKSLIASVKKLTAAVAKLKK